MKIGRNGELALIVFHSTTASCEAVALKCGEIDSEAIRFVRRASWLHADLHWWGSLRK